MPRDLFTSDTRRAEWPRPQWYAMPLAVATHTLAIGTVVVVPLLATGAFPTPQTVLAIAVPPPAPEPPPPPPVDAPAPPTPVPSPDINPHAAPAEAPSVTTAPPPMFAGVVGIRPTDRVASVADPVTLAVPPPPPRQESSGPLPVGGNIREPRKIHHVAPLYPMIARAAKVEGAVILEATIAKDGSVTGVRILRSVPMLDEAAVSAVREWRYSVPTLNGQPVDVLMTVTVRFALSR